MYRLGFAKSSPAPVAYRERYKVDLPSQMAECEANYFRLQKLLVQHFQKPVAQQQGDQNRFMVSKGAQQWLVDLNIVERSPYTTTLQMAHTAGTTAVSNWLHLPKLTVRMYHDAKLAEVLAWEGHKRLRPRYDYPNQAMYQRDEKLQINHFLGELLTRCLSHGYEMDEIINFTKI
ncbi:DUF1249 domain-containing protein [Cellvibrio sp.]|uniref:DUF1249 domain-containing protein n=1 Tax=Cellvibrio sp. TaxID=1965322 RepID=UPI0039647673